MAIIVSRFHAAVLSEPSAPHRHIDSSQHIDFKMIAVRERGRQREREQETVGTAAGLLKCNTKWQKYFV